MLLRRSVLWIAVLVLVVAACGGSDDEASDGDADSGVVTTSASSGDGGADDTPDTSAPDDDGGDTPDTTVPPEDDGGETPAQPEVTEMGSFTVNDTEFAVTFLNRCIPFEGPDSETIDLQPIAQGQGAQLLLYGTADSVEVTMQGSGIDEMFGSIAFVADPFDSGEIQESSIDGDRWTGTATLEDIRETAEPIVVTWDVMIPPEAVDCSL